MAAESFTDRLLTSDSLATNNPASLEDAYRIHQIALTKIKDMLTAREQAGIDTAELKKEYAGLATDFEMVAAKLLWLTQQQEQNLLATNSARDAQASAEERRRDQEINAQFKESLRRIDRFGNELRADMIARQLLAAATTEEATPAREA